MKVINKRSITLIIAIVLSVLIYIFWDASFASYLIIVSLLMFIGSLFCILFTGKKIEISVNAPIQGVKSTSSKATISVRNKSRIPVFRCLMTLRVSNLLTGEEDSEVYSFGVGRRRPKKIQVPVTSKYCGAIRIDASEFRVTDSIGLFSKKVKLINKDMEFCGITYYMPTAVETAFDSEDLSVYDMESYRYSSDSKGEDPAETFDIKNYETGDSIKSIHWKLSSKTDKLVVKEHGLPIDNNVLILIDKSTENITPEKADFDAEFVASLSYSLLKKEIHHTLGWYDSAGGLFESGRVKSVETFWNSMKGLIRAPYKKEELSVVDRYIGSDKDKGYTGYIYVSDNAADIEKLMTYGQVDLYRPEDYR